jgi:transposase-like protein
MILTTPAPETYTRFSCPHPHCAQFTRSGTGHIAHRAWTGKARHIARLRCPLCHREFSEREGTLMARSKLPETTVIQLGGIKHFGEKRSRANLVLN